MLRPTVTDHAGTRVPMVYVGVWFPFRGIGPIPFAVQREIEPRLRERDWGSVAVYFRSGYPYVSAVAMLGLGVILVSNLLSGRVGTFMFAAVFLVGPIGFTSLFQYYFGAGLLTRRDRQFVTDWLTSRGYCGSCGYALPSASNADTGLCNCPECGAAWRKGVAA